MFIIEENKVVFLATDLVDPSKPSKSKLLAGSIGMYPTEMYGCKCNKIDMQSSVFPTHIYYSEHDKENHVLNSGYMCPKCSVKLPDIEFELYTCSCGVEVEQFLDKIVMWD